MGLKAIKAKIKGLLKTYTFCFIDFFGFDEAFWSYKV